MSATADQVIPLKIRVCKEFAECFQLVTEHYRCTAEEIEIMRNVARAHINDAEVCYRELAIEIRNKGAAVALN